MMTIRRRLLVLLLPALALLMLLGGLVDYWIAAATTRTAYDQALASAAYATAAYLRIDAGELRFDLSSERAASLRDGASGVTLYAIVGPDGRLIAGTPGLPAAGGSGNPSLRDARFEGVRLRVATLHTRTAAGAVTVTVAESLARRAGTQRVMLYGKLLVDFAELDILLLLIWIAVYFGLKPLGRLRTQVEARSTRELQRFDEAQVPGEVRPVIVAFNRLLELLREAALVQHRFVADAAHQMRTPVAGLLAQIELLLQAPAAQAVQPQLQSMHRGIVQLAHAANQLLALARAEPLSASPESFQTVALRPLVEQLVERNLERADRAGLDLGADTADASVSGDAWLLEDLLGNLIDNAIKYTPQGGRVTVRCGSADGRPLLEVEDDGPGIPESERLRVRERFYRRPGSAGVGVGLGLAIVEEIARVHRATLSIETGANGRGARMRVRFRPAAT